MENVDRQEMPHDLTKNDLDEQMWHEYRLIHQSVTFPSSYGETKLASQFLPYEIGDKPGAGILGQIEPPFYMMVVGRMIAVAVPSCVPLRPVAL